MRLTSPPRIVVASREDKQTKLQDFITQDLASRRDTSDEDVAHIYTLIARAPDSPVAQALQAVAADIAAANVTIRVVLLETEPFAEDAIPASVLELSAADVRLLMDHRFAAAHEQLWLGDTRVWIGDCMRRDPAKRDAFEIYHTGDSKAAAHANASFAKVWAAAKPMKRLSTAAVSPDVIHAGQAADAGGIRPPAIN